ncbi:MAG: 4-(cytidine 5'-diphospho)-2-C-methyl-D-erythritol kinase [Phycisphaerae bacterium]
MIMQRREKYEYDGDALIVNAPAKVNIYLLIAGKRPDGFHEIDTLMTKIAWYDSLRFEKRKSGGVVLRCDGTYRAPEDESNLVLRAVRRIVSMLGIAEPDLQITLTKNLPAGAGLGGASSDCAATIQGLDKFLSLGMNEEQMFEVASELGSDIAFFLGGPTARCRGRGELVEPVKIDNSDCVFTLFLPCIHCSTPEVYKKYRHNAVLYKKNIADIESMLKHKPDFQQLVNKRLNMLEKACFKAYPSMKTFHDQCVKCNLKLNLSGSGSIFYAVKSGYIMESAYTNVIITFGDTCARVEACSNRW